MQPVKRRTGPKRTSGSTNSSSDRKILLAARVSRKLHERVQSECVRREWSVQELITTAVELFLEMPYEKYEFVRLTPSDSLPMKLWSTYMEKMPEEKIELMMNAMRWDLRMKKSSRRR
jgi:hypothetical protein